MDKDSGIAGVPGLSQRDQRRSQDSASVRTSPGREPQTGVLRVWSEDAEDCRDLRTSLEEAVEQACESAAVRRVALQFGLAASTVRAIDLRYLPRWAQG
jgi:hypothetical protein